MTRPQPLWRIAGTRACARKNGVRRLIPSVCSQLSRVILSAGCRRFTPAALTKMSGEPNGCEACSTNFGSRSASLKSTATNSQFPPCVAICAAVLASCYSRRAATTTDAPALAKAVAIVRPMPAPPPVTRATFPESAKSSLQKDDITHSRAGA